jgi:hypothetical protein
MPCPIHGYGAWGTRVRPVPTPSTPYKAATVIDVIDAKGTIRPCLCTGACRTLGYCPANPPQSPTAMRPDEV